MAGSEHSAHWHLVGKLKPALAPEARCDRHSYRGRTWFVLTSATAAHTFRLSLTARRLLGYMDGQRSVAQIWSLAEERFGEDSPTQDELVTLLGQLHNADVLICDISPDIAELFARAARERRTKWIQLISSPMSLKLFKVDPNRFLEWAAPYVRPWWNRWGLLVWAVTVIPALVLAGIYWPALTQNLSDRLIAPDNVLLLGTVFAGIKACHELGHAFGVKVKGGEVHELGIMALVFFPVPYVDATAANALRSKWERSAIGAAGMLVETFLAALAMFAWVLLEPGLLRSVMFNVMAIAGVSTVIFNGNPLLRYDAYYILADLVEMPNLAARSMRYYGFLFERFLFGVRDDSFPRSDRAERLVYLCYAPLSFIYRTLVSVWIILYVAGEYFVIGVLLALWAVVTMLLIPGFRVLKHVVSSPRLERKRARVRGVLLAGIAVLVALLGYVPAPLRTQSQGIVWLPEEAIVRASTAGFFTRFLVEPGRVVATDEPLIQLEEGELEAERAATIARLRELKAAYENYRVDDPVQAKVVRQQLAQEQTVLRRLDERAAGLVLDSPNSGRFLVPRAADLAGRFFRKGEVIGYVVGDVKPVIRTIVAQENVHLVRDNRLAVTVRSAEMIDRVLPAVLVREVPGGTYELPNAALGTAGGGKVAVDSSQGNGVTALERYFQFDLDADLVSNLDLLGGRVYVRFEHRGEPLAAQWYRRLRQLFLSRFNV